MIIKNSEALLIYEMANNHQGNIEHGLRIIEEITYIKKQIAGWIPTVRIAVKFQYRNYSSFIHKKADPNSKYVRRFQTTKLSDDELLSLVEAAKQSDLIVVITPFDEPSVAKCVQHEADILKVASCSANDWPLLETIVNTNKPVIASTGGCDIKEIDRLVSYLEHNLKNEFALMHCVSIYPTPNHKVNLSFMRQMQERYEQPIGYSGHESPYEHAISQSAVASGARILERHFGVATPDYPLNQYSLNQKNGLRWAKAVQEALMYQGNGLKTGEEYTTIRKLSRMAFASEPIKCSEQLGDRRYFAFPAMCDEQTSVAEYNPSAVASQDYDVDDPIVDKKVDPIYEMRSVIHEAKGLLRAGRIYLGKQHGPIELSHHYGLSKFRQFGAIIINITNREYCKKIIICLPGQRHPLHHHTKKEETFFVLHGSMTLELKGESIPKIQLDAGDQFLVQRGMVHGWQSDDGCVFEEISTTHLVGDSYYADQCIAALDPTERKTIIQQW